MPIELILSPIYRPLVVLRAMMEYPHRASSAYVPKTIELEEAKAHSYTIAKEFGTGSKVWSVFDTADPYVPTYDRRLYHMVRSRAVKGAYKLYTAGIDEPTAALRAGIHSNVLMIRNTATNDHFELGWHAVGHTTDALDSYRTFQLRDGATYQWSARGKTMERVRNAGQRESEVREQVARAVLNGSKGFTLLIDERKVNREIVITTAMICFLDQWNTAYGVGGIYYPYKRRTVPWRRS